MPVATRETLATLQDGAEETGAGTTLVVCESDLLTVQVAGTFTGTVDFEGTIDDASWFAVGMKPVNDGVAVLSTTAAGAWKLPRDGPALTKFRANVSAFTEGSGSVTVKAFTRLG